MGYSRTFYNRQSGRQRETPPEPGVISCDTVPSTTLQDGNPAVSRGEKLKRGVEEARFHEVTIPLTGTRNESRPRLDIRRDTRRLPLSFRQFRECVRDVIFMRCIQNPSIVARFQENKTTHHRSVVRLF